MLVQGIAWVDIHNFQIIRLRTDLLAPRREIHLERLTTTVTFSEVRVYAQFNEFDISPDLSYALTFRNDHQYTDYQSYRVSVKAFADLAKAVPPAYVLPTEESDQSYYANAHSYLEDPLEKLGKQIPELKKAQPSADPGALPGILEKTAGNIDGFLQHIVDLIAQEKITQEKLNDKGMAIASERVQDNYLIVRYGNEVGAEMVEYRMDGDGNRLDHIGLNKGFLVTIRFALNCNYF
jgi:hypothetical protein